MVWRVFVFLVRLFPALITRTGSMLAKAMLGPWRSNGEHLILIPGRRGTGWFSARLGMACGLAGKLGSTNSLDLQANPGLDRGEAWRVDGAEVRHLGSISQTKSCFFMFFPLTCRCYTELSIFAGCFPKWFSKWWSASSSHKFNGRLVIGDHVVVTHDIHKSLQVFQQHQQWRYPGFAELACDNYFLITARWKLWRKTAWSFLRLCFDCLSWKPIRISPPSLTFHTLGHLWRPCLEASVAWDLDCYKGHGWNA